jgi:hypothetical protein
MQAVVQQNGVEVHQQGYLAAAQAKVGARLRFVDWQDALDSLEFQEDRLRYDDIGEVTLVQVGVFVDDSKRDLALEFEVGMLQFPTAAVVLDGLEQTGTRCAMQLDGEADYAVGQHGARFFCGHGGWGHRWRVVDEGLIVRGLSVLAAGLFCAEFAETQRSPRRSF